MSDEFQEMDVRSPEQEFELADGVWEGVRNHPLLKQELEEKMQAEAQRRAEAMVEQDQAALLETVRKKAEEAGREAGLRQGIEESGAVLEKLEKLVNEAATKLSGEMKAWTLAMETEWSQALTHLLSQLAVPNGQGRGDAIAQWVKAHLDDSFEDQKIQIFLGEDDWKLVEDAGVPAAGESWVWQKDPDLGPGQVRCESRLGRLFLDPDAALNRIEAVLNHE